MNSDLIDSFIEDLLLSVLLPEQEVLSKSQATALGCSVQCELGERSGWVSGQSEQEGGLNAQRQQTWFVCQVTVLNYLLLRLVRFLYSFFFFHAK